MAFENSSTFVGNDVVIMGFAGQVNVDDDDRAFSVMAFTGAKDDDDEATDCCCCEMAVITAVLLDIFAADFPRMS